MLTTDTPRYEVEILFDELCDNPTDYGLFQIVSFNNRHMNNGNPSSWLPCQYEYEDGFVCDGWPSEHPTSDVTDSEPHEMVPNPLFIATLSYYEHGLCKWMVGPSTVPDYGGFDTVGVAGVIAWKDDESKQEYHEYMSEHEKLSYERYRERLMEVCEAVVEEYTAWANGYCFGYKVNERNPETGEYDIEVDSCWGFIGDYVYEAAKECMDAQDPKEGVDYVLKEEW